MKRFCLALDLVEDSQLISEYEEWHRHVWPEIEKSILESGIRHMQIYRLQSRLFMIMDTNDDFDFDKKHASDTGNPKVQEWEKLMWKYQLAVPGGKPGEKWRIMDKIFELSAGG